MRCVSSNRCMRIPTTSNAMQAQALDSSQVSLMVPATFYALSFSPCSFSHSTIGRANPERDVCELAVGSEHADHALDRRGPTDLRYLSPDETLDHTRR